MVPDLLPDSLHWATASNHKIEVGSKPIVVVDTMPAKGESIRSFSPQSEGWHQVFEGLKSLLTAVKTKLK